MSLTPTAGASSTFGAWTGCDQLDGTVCSVTMNAARNLTAQFVIQTRSVSFRAGAGGTLTGTTSQTVNYGDSATPVTAYPAAGYHFVNWSDANNNVVSSANPLTVTNVTVNLALSANFAVNVTNLPDLTITKSHQGNFSRGQTGANYTITASNSGSATTKGTVTVIDTLPSGLSATAISGSGWSCTLRTLTCTRSSTLAAGSSYPPITLTVTVASNASSSLINVASVSGGGETNGSNNTASDPTTIPAAGYTVSGSITPAPSGAGATVTLTQGASTAATVTAASDGSFSFPSIGNGSYTVTPTKAGVSFKPASAAVTVNGANATGINFTTAGLAIDVTVSADSHTSATTVATSAFSTKAGNELLLAFISTDATGATPNITVTGVKGGGLTWTLVKRSNAQFGTAEIWRAFASAAISNATVSATLSQKIPASSLTVIGFTGVNVTTPVGAVGGASGATGAATASLTTQGANSWVFGVGNDWYGNLGRTVGANQALVHQYLSYSNSPEYYDSFWVQRQNASVQPAATVVVINDSAPVTDGWNLSLVEIRQ